jgi:hypothetical protein
MSQNLERELATLRRLTAKELQQRFVEVIGEETPDNNKAWLIKRVAWRLQALAEGDLSECARRRAEELANDSDLRIIPLRFKANDGVSSNHISHRNVAFWPDNRLPLLGTVLTRKYKEDTLQV